MSSKRLTDYVDRSALQMLQDSLGELAGVPVAITTPQGRRILPLGPDHPLETALGDPGESVDHPAIAGAAKAAGQPKSARRVLIHKSEKCLPILSAPIILTDKDGLDNPPEHLGTVVVGTHPTTGPMANLPGATPKAVDEEWLGRLTRVMADTIANLCSQRRQLESRMSELNILYHVSELVSGEENLQKVLEGIAQCVVEVMRAKGCTLRLLDRDRKNLELAAVWNLSESYLRKGAIALENSPLDRRALAGEIVEISDIPSDPHVGDSYRKKAIREGLVSGLMVGLHHKGKAIGSIRVYMDRTHRFTGFEKSLLRAVGGQAAAAIINARLYESALKTRQVRRQVRMARDVQRRMLPPKPPQRTGLDIAAVYDSCFELGGDFYDFIELPGNDLGLTIADVSGKGVPASLLMASTRSALRAHAQNHLRVKDVIERVNRQLVRETLTSEFVTLFFGALDCRDGWFNYVNAGHEPPLLFRAGQTAATGKEKSPVSTLADDLPVGVEPLEVGGMVVGMIPTTIYEQGVVRLNPGDVLLLYTDGLTDAIDFKEDPFGRDRVVEAVLARQGQSARAIAKHVLWELRHFVGLADQPDDISLVVIRWA